MKITKDDLGWELEELETAAVIVDQEQTNGESQSNTESSSSEDSDGTAEETSSEEDSDSESVEDLNLSQRDCKVSPEVSVPVTQHGITKGDIFCSISCDDDKKPSAVTEERFSKGEILGDIETRPSLFFGKKRDGGKPLVEVIRGEEHETENELPLEENLCNVSYNGEKHVESSHNEGTSAWEGEQGTDFQHADVENDHGLSGKIQELSINDDAK